jgi:hypothetical protein
VPNSSTLGTSLGASGIALRDALRPPLGDALGTAQEDALLGDAVVRLNRVLVRVAFLPGDGAFIPGVGACIPILTKETGVRFGIVVLAPSS